MKDDRWQQAKIIFNEALDKTSAGRTAFLNQACADDLELRHEVESLLTAYSDADQFIETPVVDDVLKLIDSRTPELAGKRIGQYKIIRKLGDGGMGAVYLAARADDEYEKQVAIKLVKFGFDNDFIVNRFLSERQILASLDHPNIARLVDGGTTDDGAPYLVMEYIEGLPIDIYCVQHDLSLGERLKLFRTVCGAVQYAHNNLVIHRDIKPSNILVTNEGRPKLLDFGIAKLLSADLSSPAQAKTATAVTLMTPDYASPEQVLGNIVTTATDVYSLGVVLYELLIGQRPYQVNSKNPQEMIRAICEVEPDKPSAALRDAETRRRGNQEQAGAKIPAARLRISESELKGDLDNIVQMALRKEPQRRYESVAQFSADIQRHLDGLPVVARKDTFKYRATKFVQRNRIGVAAAAIILLSLVAGVVATAWQARAAAQQARVAQQEKARAESINAFLEKLLTYSNPVSNAAPGKGHPTTMEEAVDEAANRIERGEFQDQPEVKAELERIIGISYNFQGRYELAMKYLEAYVTTERGLNDEDNPKTLEASTTWATVLAWKSDLTGSEQIFRRVLPLMRTEYRQGTLKPAVLADAVVAFGYLRRTQGDSREAEALFREAVALTPQVPADSRYLVRLSRSTLASSIADQGRFAEALQTSRDAVEEFRRNGETELPDFGFSLTVLGGFLSDTGDNVGADIALKNGESIFRKLLRPTHLWLGDNLRNQAISLYRQGKFAEAESKINETLGIYLESFGKHYDNYPTALIFKGLILNRTGRSQAGELLLREAVSRRSQSLPKDHFWVAVANSALGECLATQHRFPEAEPYLTQSYAILNTRLGKQDPRTTEALNRLVKFYDAWGKTEEVAHFRALL
ncbi:MAG TPA: serine/threonine-protein kinase [Pyrinomonadaceae bacterium]|nr:serine/threonine-protein kinase [Pyrinomonadaceae bacterium]